jgi:hypothetical protein
MNGVEVRIEPFGDEQAIVRIMRAPDGLPWGGPAKPLDVTVALANASIKEVGNDLFARLSVNDDAEAALSQLLQRPADTMNPVYLEIDETTAKTFPWEQLCVDDTFFSLEWSWQIARMTRPLRQANRPYVTAPRLTLLVVLSALGRQAIGEWNSIKDAVETGWNLGLDIRLLVSASELDVRGAIDRYIADDNHHVTRLDPPASAGDVRGLIQDHKPQLVHLYAHGSLRDGARILTLAKPTDWDDPEKAHGSLNIKLADVARAARDANTWLVVLNACKSAAAEQDQMGGEDDVRSFAGDLVAEGVPAAIGHRRAIESIDAHRFALPLYEGIFRILQQPLSQPGRHELEWASVMFDAREKLLEAHGGDPSTADNWSVPVLYVRPTEFLIDVAADDQEKDTVTAVRLRDDLANDALDALENFDLPPGMEDQFMRLSTGG